MVTDMVTLVGEDDEVIGGVIEGIVIGVMDYMFWFKGIESGSDRASDTVSGTVRDIFFVTGINPGIPAIGGAEEAVTVTDLTFRAKDRFRATGAGDGNFMFSGIDSCLFKDTPDILAGDLVFCGKGYHGDEVNVKVCDDGFHIGFDVFSHGSSYRLS
jgi:hypothetical protein